MYIYCKPTYMVKYTRLGIHMNIISLSRFMTHFSVSSVTSLPTTSLPIMLQEAEEVATNPSEDVVPVSNFHGVCITDIFTVTCSVGLGYVRNDIFKF